MVKEDNKDKLFNELKQKIEEQDEVFDQISVLDKRACNLHDEIVDLKEAARLVVEEGLDPLQAKLTVDNDKHGKKKRNSNMYYTPERKYSTETAEMIENEIEERGEEIAEHAINDFFHQVKKLIAKHGGNTEGY